MSTPTCALFFPQDDGIFQQDNERCHTAASVRAWFEEHQDEFTVLPLPANSPDLNPIEHLWYHLDRVVRAMDPQSSAAGHGIRVGMAQHPREHL
ncbi:transposable element Tcb1 transposase [Trichonephila clavipes]|nr:transposable element Tcb1 transposase [Trichonephila clavipes]